MVSGNPSSQILKILSPQNLSLKLEALKLEAFAQAFKPGDTLEGRVTQVLARGRAVVQFNGKPVLIELDQALRTGQRLTAQVEQTTPSPVLKLLRLHSPPPAPQQDTPATKTPPPSDVTATLSRLAVHKENKLNPSLPNKPAEAGSTSNANASAGKKAPATQNPATSGAAGSLLKTGNENSHPLKPAVESRPAGPSRPHSSAEPAASSRANRSSSPPGIVTRLSSQGSQTVAAEHVLTRQDLQRLQLEPNVRALLQTVRVQDAGTLIARSGSGEVTVPVPHAALFRAGDPVVATPRPVQNGFFLEATPSEQQVRPVTPQLIKPMIAARQPLGDMVYDLRKVIQEFATLQDSKIDPELIGKLRDTLRLLHPPKGEGIEASRLQEMVDRSGIQYEGKVKNLLLQGDGADRLNRLQFDLKGQLLELASKMEEAAHKPGTAATRPLHEILQTVQRAVQNIEFHQLSNQFSKQEQLPQLLPVPHSLFEGESDFRIYVRHEGEDGQGASSKNKETYNLVFLLDMTALGPLRIDTQVRQEGVSVSIQGENAAVIEFIQARIPEWETRMQEMGFAARIAASLKQHVDREVPDIMSEWVIQEPARLVDIET